jgi:hypothetical protein
MTTVRTTDHTPGPGLELATDIRLGFMLLNEMRYQAFEFVGVRREDANIATVVVAALAAEGAHRRASQLLRFGKRKRPSRGDVVVAGGVAGELLHELGGPSSRDVRFYGAMIVLSVAATRAGPVVRQSIDGVVGVSHSALDAFHRHYGYLVGRARSVAETRLADTRLAETRLGEVVLGESKTDESRTDGSKTGESAATAEPSKTVDAGRAAVAGLMRRLGLRRGAVAAGRSDQRADDPHHREDDADHEQDVVAFAQGRDAEPHQGDEVRDREDDPQQR